MALNSQLSISIRESHRRHVAQSRHRARQQDSVASARGFQVVQETDHRPFRSHGAKDLREPRAAAAESHEYRRHPRAACAWRAIRNSRRPSARRASATGGRGSGGRTNSASSASPIATCGSCATRASWPTPLKKSRPERELFVIGGAQIYAQLLDRCTDLYLSVVQREVEGDAYFPEFEDRWRLHDIPLRTADFEVRHFRRLGA